MNSEELINSQWRSLDHNDSITEPINFGPQFVDDKDNKTFANDIFTYFNAPERVEGNLVLEGELLNAMSNLQIVSAKKNRKFQDPIMPIQVPFNECDKKINNLILDVPSIEITKCETQIHDETKNKLNPNDTANFTKPNLEIQNMVAEAKKLLIPQSSGIKPPSSKSQSKSHNTTLNNRPMMHTNFNNKTLNNTTLNQTTIEPYTRMKSNIDKKPSKKIVKLITETTNGIQLKEEKINYFGIPMTFGCKKRTQAKPFSFESRTKSTEVLNPQSIQSKTAIKPSSSATLRVPLRTALQTRSNTSTSLRQPLKTTGSSLAAATLASKAKIVTKLRQNDRKTNVENKTPNIITNGGSKIKSQPVTAPPKLHSDKRAKERLQFDAKVKQREQEMERMRAIVEENKREKEKRTDINLRKVLESKANSMNNSKVPAAIRSNKPLTEQQSSARAIKSKK